MSLPLRVYINRPKIILACLMSNFELVLNMHMYKSHSSSFYIILSDSNKIILKNVQCFFFLLAFFCQCSIILHVDLFFSVYFFPKFGTRAYLYIIYLYYNSFSNAILCDWRFPQYSFNSSFIKEEFGKCGATTTINFVSYKRVCELAELTFWHWNKNMVKYLRSFFLIKKKLTIKVMKFTFEGE